MANNDLADLNSRLATAIRDTTHVTWVSAEKDEIIERAVDQLWPRYNRPLDPSTTTIALTDDVGYYSLPAGVRAVSRLDLLDSSSNYLGPIQGRSWEIVGDTLRGTGKLHLNPDFAVTGQTLQLHGYGIYDTATNLIPDEFAMLVLARARAEAYRRVAADRERFKAWLVRNQVQNVSVNELYQHINEADSEANRLVAATPRTWQKPVSAWVG